MLGTIIGGPDTGTPPAGAEGGNPPVTGGTPPAGGNNQAGGNNTPGSNPSEGGNDKAGVNLWEKPVSEFLPDDMKNDPLAGKYKNLAEFFKGFKETQALVGKKIEGHVKVPTEKSTPEEQQAFLRAIGVPENPEGYQLPEKLPEGAQLNDNLVNWFRQNGHKHALTPGQFQGLLMGYVELEQQMLDQSVQQLKESYGDKYEDAVKRAGMALSRLPKEMQEAVKGSTSIELFYVLDYFGNLLSEGKAPTDKNGMGPSDNLKAELEGINKKLRDPKEREKMTDKERKGLVARKTQILKELG